MSSPEYAWIRLHGKAVFENNMPAKEMCLQNPIVKGQYGEATNPIFEVLYLENAHGIIADFCILRGWQKLLWWQKRLYGNNSSSGGWFVNGWH